MSGGGAPPALGPEPGWIELPRPLPQAWAERSYVLGDRAGDRLAVRYYLRLSDQVLVGKAWFGPAAVGPPGIAHGGSVASVLDDAMGAACFEAGQTGVVARLGVEFREAVPLSTVALLEARLERRVRRKIELRARLATREGRVYAGAEALFVILPAGRFE